MRSLLSRAWGTAVLGALLALAAALPSPAAAASAAQTKTTLASVLRSLPGSSSVYIREAATGTVLGAKAQTSARIPASVTKLFTTSSVLMLDGPTTKLTTELRMRGTVDGDGVLHGDLIVRGAGDPSLRLDQVSALAAGAKQAGITRLDGTLRANLGAWTAQQGTPKTGGRYDHEIGGRLGALVTLRGFSSGTVTDPAQQVLVRLRAALGGAGVKGTIALGAPTASGTGTKLLAHADSPTIAQLIASTNGPSDNFYAEMLLRGLGARHGQAGTTGAGVTAERAALAAIGVRATLFDGSGLSRRNRVRTTTLVKLLDAMAGRAEGAALRASLPLAGSTGTLAGRMRGTAAAGRCRAKTGTLSNVSALAGYCTTIGRRTVSFAILMNKVSVPASRRYQDRIAAAIAAWSDPATTAITPKPTTPAATTPAATTPQATTPVTSGGISG